MKRILIMIFSVGGFALIGHGWLSDVLPLQTKITLTVIGIAMIAAAIVAQWKWNTPTE